MDKPICPKVTDREDHGSHMWAADDQQRRYCGGWANLRPIEYDPVARWEEEGGRPVEVDQPYVSSTNLSLGDIAPEGLTWKQAIGQLDYPGDPSASRGFPPDELRLALDLQQKADEDLPGQEDIPLHNHSGIRPMGHHCPECEDEPLVKREVQKWADSAMYKAEEIDATDGPRVYLLWMTPDPLGAIAAACKMYKGEVVRDLSTVTDAERLEFFDQVQRTKLKAPFEFVRFHFMIEGVTRAFTHQMVRQRTAAYAQESLRFAVKEDMPVGLPPSLAGTGLGEENRGANAPMGPQAMRDKWNYAIGSIRRAYQDLIDMGMPAEDTRGLLPTNVLTRLHYTTDLRALLDHAGNRLCTQAQFEWRLVFAKIIEAIRNAHTGGWSEANGITKAYRTNVLLDAFKPVCFQTGKCEFKANFDRPCSIRERVDANERAGRPSSEWDKEPERFTGHPELEIPAIKPGEWLLDPGAARRK